jgi:Domain of unknown function (DUF1929)/Glyoxal oxidase N-terminus
MRRIDRRAFLKGAALAGAATALGIRGRSASAVLSPAEVGEWSSQVPLGIVGIHAALLHTGDVLYYQHRDDPGEGSKARRFDPTTLSSVDVGIPFNRDIMCSGMSFLADGRLLATGGEPDDPSEPLGTGNPYTTLFQPTTNTWSDSDPMQFVRWYPSNALLPNGTVLIMGGTAGPGGTGNIITAVESYDPTTETVSRLPTSADKWLGLYPRTFLLWNGQIFKAGKGKRTLRFDPAVNKWFFVADMNGGGRKRGSAVLLSGGRKVLTCGGQGPDGRVTGTSEVIDMSAAQPQWRFVEPLTKARQNHNLVLLPDGTVLCVGGGNAPGQWASPVGLTELFDPGAETWAPMASHSTNRTYHSTAILLADGRVISGGANSREPEQTTVEFYSPPYLFRGTRPKISSVNPSNLRYGDECTISTPSADVVDRVVLLKPGANTHSLNFDQRHVELDFTTGADDVTATIPSNRALVPPGYYMLFILSGSGVPSVARFLRVS